jgi:hypothetical protein
MRDARAPWVVALALALAATACHKRPEQGVVEATAGREDRPSEGRSAAPEEHPAAAPAAVAPPDGPPPAAEPASPESARIRRTIARAHELLAALDGRTLTPAQRLNAQSAGSFALQAVQALDEADLERASVLSDKALTLLEAVASETSSEPE